MKRLSRMSLLSVTATVMAALTLAPTVARTQRATPAATASPNGVPILLVLGEERTMGDAAVTARRLGLNGSVIAVEVAPGSLSPGTLKAALSAATQLRQRERVSKARIEIRVPLKSSIPAPPPREVAKLEQLGRQLEGAAFTVVPGVGRRKAIVHFLE